MHKVVLVACLTVAAAGCVPSPDPDLGVDVPAGIDHGTFDRLLSTYVDDRGLVDYDGWRHNEDDVGRLQAYLSQFAERPARPASGTERVASLINAYNALAIQTILVHYPVESIQQVRNPFTGRRHLVGGREVSLDEIEHHSLRPLIGHKAHTVLVCAARSCPPLQRYAFAPGELDRQIDRAYRTWLSREDLNRYYPEENRVMISSIFNWFSADYDAVGGIRPVLAAFGPEEYREFLAGSDYAIEYLEYNWGLNDHADPIRDYRMADAVWDRVRGWLRLQ